MPTATITSKGQVTIPKPVRDHLRLAAGDRLEFVLDDRGVVTLRPARRAARELYGFLERPGARPATPREIDEEIAEVVAADHERIARGG
jgi:AbrB family looped-hinge helix DNA binding protein